MNEFKYLQLQQQTNKNNANIESTRDHIEESLFSFGPRKLSNSVFLSILVHSWESRTLTTWLFDIELTVVGLS